MRIPRLLEFLSQHFVWVMIMDHHIYSFVDSCSADFPLQITLGFATVSGEEPCECNSAVCYCSKWEKRNANTWLKYRCLYFDCSLLKLLWLMFGGVIFFSFLLVCICVFFPLQTSLFVT